MKIWGFSKAGKITLGVIIGIIVGVFAIIGFFSVKIFYTQLQNERQGLSYGFTSADEMLENIMNIFGYSQGGMMSNYKFNFMGQNFFAMSDEDKTMSFIEMVFGDTNGKTISINDNFTGTELNDTRVYLVIPYNSKFANNFGEGIYGDEVDERGQPIRIGNKIHEIKIELKNARNYHGMIAENNSNYKHFWEKSIRFNGFNRYANSTEDIKPLETACVILTSLNPITQTDKSLHDEGCEYWHLETVPGYNEIVVEFGTLKDIDSDVIPEIKITPISIDVPIFTNKGKTSR